MIADSMLRSVRVPEGLLTFQRVPRLGLPASSSVFEQVRYSSSSSFQSTFFSQSPSCTKRFRYMVLSFGQPAAPLCTHNIQNQHRRLLINLDLWTCLKQSVTGSRAATHTQTQTRIRTRSLQCSQPRERFFSVLMSQSSSIQSSSSSASNLPESFQSRVSVPTPGLASENVVLLNIDNMRCAGCVNSVRKQVMKHEQLLQAVSVSLPAKSALLQWKSRQNVVGGDTAEEILSVEKVRDAVIQQIIKDLSEAGFPASVKWDPFPTDRPSSHAQAQDQAQAQAASSPLIRLLKTTVFPLLSFTALISLATAFHCAPWMLALPFRVTPFMLNVVQFAIFFITFLVSKKSRQIVRQGFKALVKDRNPNMDSLITMGILSSLVGSMFGVITGAWKPFVAENAMLLAVVVKGRQIEESLQENVRTDAEAWIRDFGPPIAKRFSESEDQLDVVLVGDLRQGDEILINPGERVPVDCQVVSTGRSQVNNAVVTGEFLPVTVTSGSLLVSGSICVSTPIRARVSKTHADSFVTQIALLVQRTQASRAPVQKFADQLASKFVWFILAASASTFMAWTWIPALSSIAMSHGQAIALKLAIDVMVIACPCALGLATPMAIFVAASSAARKGILFRDAQHIESAAKIRFVAFDKTGTLTTGTPRVATIVPYSSYNSETILKIARSLEYYTSHPLRKAFMQPATDRFQCTDVAVKDGSGISGIVHFGNEQTHPLGRDSAHAFIGKFEWMIDLPQIQQSHHITSVVEQMRDKGETVVALAIDEKVIALMGITDEIRAESQKMLSDLKDMSITTAIISGDSSKSVNRLGEYFNINKENLFSSLLPEEKLMTINKLKYHNGSRSYVAMVGDGVNDAPSLAGSDLGISVGDSAQITSDVADVVLLKSSNIRLISDVFLIGQCTLKTIRQNFGWALGYNLICLPIASGLLLPSFGIMLSPSLAGGAMAFSSIGVVLNSLRLQLALSRSKETPFDEKLRALRIQHNPSPK